MLCSRSCLRFRLRTIKEVGVAVITLVHLATPALGFELEDPETFAVKRTWADDDLGIGQTAGLLFNRSGDTLYVASGRRDPQGSALYSFDVIRNSATREITALENRQFVFSSSLLFNDGTLTAGWAFGPDGTLFSPYGWPGRLGERPGGVDGTEKVFLLAATRLPEPSAAGVAFSPYITDPNTGFGMMQLSDFSLFEHRIWNVPLLPIGDGYFEPQEAEILADFPGVRGWEGTPPSVAGDIAYIPSGSHQGDLLVADFNGGEINILNLDKQTGWPIDRVTNRPTLGTFDPQLVRFAGVIKPWVDGTGPWGFEFDPLTNDLFVSMHNGTGGVSPDSIIQIGGFPPPEDAANVVRLQPGDADMDLDFDQLDLVQVQIAAKYLTGQAATWGQGDWDGAPGGRPGDPPAGNGFFDQLDIIVALLAGTYLSGPYAAIRPGGREGDSQTSIIYNATTGELALDAPAGAELTSINIDSAAAVFTGQPAQNLGGSFDNDAAGNVFKATFGSSFGSLSFGHVARTGLAEEFMLNDLTVIGSLAGGGQLGSVDLIYVPEPGTAMLAILGLLVVMNRVWHRSHSRGASHFSGTSI